MAFNRIRLEGKAKELLLQVNIQIQSKSDKGIRYLKNHLQKI